MRGCGCDRWSIVITSATDTITHPQDSPSHIHPYGILRKTIVIEDALWDGVVVVVARIRTIDPCREDVESTAVAHRCDQCRVSHVGVCVTVSDAVTTATAAGWRVHQYR